LRANFPGAHITERRIKDVQQVKVYVGDEEVMAIDAYEKSIMASRTLKEVVEAIKDFLGVQ
jgi:hypothetical protein